ncbi:hypothetical protein F9802_04750 [Bacillus aerolatus]|uniref:Uncharacterized protein n=1 Tax=Bacillus aerolatus TaxID=2653354 RepID=A0A6I1FNJ8_9BACI|nr:hypothetical protein [Bacillus aerolatus]KAB7708024.1 hypothetical protein F9802_04750 [Bacillus aerolatus]
MTSIRRTGEVAFFSHAAGLAYDLEPQGGGAGQRKAESAYALAAAAHVAVCIGMTIFNYIFN